jgi:spore coat protein CotH
MNRSTLPSPTLLATVIGVACSGSEDYGTGPQVWSEPIAHLDDGFLFDQTRINRIDLSLDAEGEKILLRERVFTQPRNEVRGQATIDGEPVGEIGIRLRGGIGSFRRYDNKPKWELDFNEFTGDRFHGLESLSLNNGVQECSGGNNHLAFFANGVVGVPTSRTGHAQLFVNGSDYGLYIVLETQDDRWLKRNFENNDGNFYDGGYLQAGPWPIPLDFANGRDGLFDLEEGEDIGASDITAISEEILAAGEDGGVSRTLWELVDWDRLLRQFAVEQWTHNDDAYVPAANNYRIYFQTDGPMVMAPWDLDATFPIPDEEDEESSLGDERFKAPGGALAEVCAQDQVCLEQWGQAARDVATLLEAPQISSFVENLLTITQEGLDGDPRGQCERQRRDDERENLLAWPAGASERLRLSWPEG